MSLQASQQRQGQMQDRLQCMLGVLYQLYCDRSGSGGQSNRIWSSLENGRAGDTPNADAKRKSISKKSPNPQHEQEQLPVPTPRPTRPPRTGRDTPLGVSDLLGCR